MKTYKLGNKNDIHIYAVETDNGYAAINESDLEFTPADAKIYFDSGVYPMTLEEVDQVMCDKAWDRLT